MNKHKLIFHDLKHELKPNKEGRWEIEIYSTSSHSYFIDFKKNKLDKSKLSSDSSQSNNNNYSFIVTQATNLSSDMKKITAIAFPNKNAYSFLFDDFKIEINPKKMRVTYLNDSVKEIRVQGKILRFDDSHFSNTISDFDIKKYFTPEVYQVKNVVYLIWVKKT